MTDLTFSRIDTGIDPLGTLLLVSGGGRLLALDFEGYEARMRALLARRFGRPPALAEGPAPADAAARLQDYLAGDHAAVDGIAVDTGGSEFRRAVWAALRTIPHGRTMTYGALAARLGRPTASRAVGHANSLNPVAIVVPCHRVIGADASLTGYAGGLARKRWLLAHEGVAV